MGTQRQLAKRFDLRNEQRNDLGHTDRVVDANILHGLGEQQRWAKCGLPQHHRRGRAADAFLFSREFDADEQHRKH